MRFTRNLLFVFAINLRTVCTKISSVFCEIGTDILCLSSRFNFAVGEGDWLLYD